MVAVGLLIDGRFTHLPDASSYLRVAAMLLPTAGLLLIASALGLFWKKGTRAELLAPASAIVTGGLYGWTRNPMYPGMLAVYAGIGLFLVSPTAGLLLVPLFLVFDRVIIAREEAYLTRRFGEAYVAYRHAAVVIAEDGEPLELWVRRW